jgi:hypothetical protein
VRCSLNWLTDGNDTYTPPVGLNDVLPGKSDILITPNPTGQSINIVYNPEKNTLVNASLMNIAGQEVMKIGNPAISGMVRQTINLADFSPGLYVLTAEINGIKTAQKVIVTK